MGLRRNEDRKETLEKVMLTAAKVVVTAIAVAFIAACVFGVVAIPLAAGVGTGYLWATALSAALVYKIVGGIFVGAVTTAAVSAFLAAIIGPFTTTHSSEDYRGHTLPEEQAVLKLRIDAERARFLKQDSATMSQGFEGSVSQLLPEAQEVSKLPINAAHARFFSKDLVVSIQGIEAPVSQLQLPV